MQVLFLSTGTIQYLYTVHIFHLHVFFQMRSSGCTRLAASSGGNAGLAAAYTARKLGMPITIYVPGSTPPYMRDRLTGEVEAAGNSFLHKSFSNKLHYNNNNYTTM